MIRPFLMYPDKRLRMVCTPVADIDEKVRGTWEDMLASMYAMPGLGLAAPQIGVMLRLAVVDCSETHDAPLCMANPEILHASVKLGAHEEGSPNMPGLWARVERPRAVTARFLDASGNVVEQDFVGVWATSVQHQIDHLNGKLFIDHLRPVKRKMLLAKHAKNMKRR